MNYNIAITTIVTISDESYMYLLYRLGSEWNFYSILMMNQYC